MLLKKIVYGKEHLQLMAIKMIPRIRKTIEKIGEMMAVFYRE